jgi:hypothetical protein
LVAFIDPPAAEGRLLQGEGQGATMPAKLEMSHPQMGVTVVGWSPNEFEVRVNPDQLLTFFDESAASRRLQSEDRVNNSFIYDDGVALEKAIQELVVDVVSSATGRTAAEMEIDYQEKFVGVYDSSIGVYRIQEEKRERRLLMSFRQLLAPVKALMATYVSDTIENMKKYGPQIA